MRKMFCSPIVACLFSLLFIQSPSYAFHKDATNHIVAMSPGVDAAHTTADMRNAVNFLISRPDKTNHWTMRLNPGKYVLSAQVSLQGLQNTTITSSDLTHPAKLIKMPGWNSASSAEYLLSFRMCKNVDLIGVELYGQTNFASNSNPNWPDQGVYFGSCNTVKIDHDKFYNFGNSALRVSTWEHDPVLGVHSFNTRVTNNLFNNIYQTSTTVQDNRHGGTAHYLMQNNTFVNLRGSVKFASRTPGAYDIHVVNNVINGGNHFGLEINNYNNFEIRGNTIENIKNVAMNIYTAEGIPGFVWGNNFTIAGNTLKNVRRAIRYSHEASADGFQNVPKNLVINSNGVYGVTEPSTYAPAIMEENGLVSGLAITNNKFSSIANNKYIGIAKGSSSVSVLNNRVNGAAYGPQSVSSSN